MNKRPASFCGIAFVLASVVGAPCAIGAADLQNPNNAVPADNTRVNERDRSRDTLTSSDQPNNSIDTKLAAAAREAIVKDKSLSTMAHNVKVIASNGTVTLRGPVPSETEKGKVAERVQSVPGVSRVDNQLDVKTN